MLDTKNVRFLFKLILSIFTLFFVINLFPFRDNNGDSALPITLTHVRTMSNKRSTPIINASPCAGKPIAPNVVNNTTIETPGTPHTFRGNH